MKHLKNKINIVNFNLMNYEITVYNKQPHAIFVCNKQTN